MNRSSNVELRRASVVSVSTAVIALALAAGCQEGRFHGTPLEPAALAPEIDGTEASGNPFRLEHHKGSVVLLTFGYTSCPEVCPLTLSRLEELRERLGGDADRVAVVFISVDPERDTRERIRSYLAAFDPSFHGVRVERRALSLLLAAYGATATVQPEERARPDGRYVVDHTSSYFLIDKAGLLRLRLSPGASVEEIQSDVLRLAREAP